MITALIVVVLVVVLVVLLAWILGAITTPDPAPPPRGIPDDPPTLVMQWPTEGFPRDEPDRVRPYIHAQETGDPWAAFREAA